MFELKMSSTDGLPACKKVQFWNELATETLTEQSADPVDPQTFSGRVRRLDLGIMRFAEICASPSIVSRTSVHIAHANEAPYILRLLLAGELVSIQDGTELRQRPGDFALIDTARPYRLYLRDETTVLSIRILKERLLTHIPCPEAITSKVISGASDAGRLTSRFLSEFWNGPEQIMLSESAPRLADIALQLVASSYAMLPNAHIDRSSVMTRQRIQLIRYIEAQLCDPELSPRQIAAALHVSPGYAHRIFSDESESIARYILRRRLERCQEALTDPLQAGRSVTEIALAFGFNSIAHFSRVFRERYKASPRAYRHAHRGNPDSRLTA